MAAPFTPLGTTWLLRIFVFLVDLWLRIFYRFDIQGLENIPEEGPCVIVGNHPGKLIIDVAAVLPFMRRRMFVGVIPSGPGGMRLKRPGWSPRLMRGIIRLIPTLHVHRGGSNPLDASVTLLQVLGGGQALLLAPEGEVSWDGRLKPARPGAAWLALRAHAPVVPVGISGTYDVWPRWAKRMHLTGRIRVRIGRPFFLSEGKVNRIDRKTLDRAGERIMAEIGKLVAS
ncbi:MAG: lysophospholipid acyltransferase family protein [Candidatus Methylomirabilales bacterium]